LGQLSRDVRLRTQGPTGGLQGGRAPGPASSTPSPATYLEARDSSNAGGNWTAKTPVNLLAKQTEWAPSWAELKSRAQEFSTLASEFRVRQGRLIATETATRATASAKKAA